MEAGDETAAVSTRSSAFWHTPAGTPAFCNFIMQS
jgi:hypothetical protein